MTGSIATLTVLSSLPMSHDPAGLSLPNRSFSCIDPCVVCSTELQGDQVFLLLHFTEVVHFSWRKMAGLIFLHGRPR